MESGRRAGNSLLVVKVGGGIAWEQSVQGRMGLWAMDLSRSLAFAGQGNERVMCGSVNEPAKDPARESYRKSGCRSDGSEKGAPVSLGGRDHVGGRVGLVDCPKRL